MLFNFKLSALLASLATVAVANSQIIDPLLLEGNGASHHILSLQADLELSATVFMPTTGGKTACGYTDLPTDTHLAGLPPVIFDSHQ